MEDITSPNFQALSKFSSSIKTDLAKHNRHVKMANVHITYTWQQGTYTTETKTYITLDNQPFAKLILIENAWLTSEDFYTEFQTGYNLFSFETETRTLTIENKGPSKMGPYYHLDIREV